MRKGCAHGVENAHGLVARHTWVRVHPAFLAYKCVRKACNQAQHAAIMKSGRVRPDRHILRPSGTPHR